MCLTEEIFRNNLQQIRAKLSLAATRAGREVSAIQLLPVTKTKPAEVIDWVAVAGLGRVGENRVQEAAAKKAATEAGVGWELIGYLQSNKAKQAATLFERIQSVDRKSLVDALDKWRGQSGLAPLPVLLQVNAGRDPAKAGVLPENAEDLLRHALQAANLKVEGLMTIAPFSDDPEVARQAFRTLAHLRDELVSRLGHPLPELSMGMSGDLEAAVEEGSTIVRVGSALFGTR